MRALLVSTYDLGRQPFGLASPAAWLRAAGVDVACADVSRGDIGDDQFTAATLIAFYLPMHTATRLAAPFVERARRLNPAARICAYGLYAPLNELWLRERGVDVVLGPEAEQGLVELVKFHTSDSGLQPPNLSGTGHELPRLAFVVPNRSGLPPLDRYASLRMSDGTRRVVGSTDATRGCKHLCRHCPIVPVYRGRFRVVPADIVLADVRAQVEAGAQHISFGDPDFFNGPTHARRIVARLARECPAVTYDVTVKIEHLLKHADLLPLLRDTGCLFVTSAVEAVDDEVLARLRKGHTRADFASAVALCRDAGLTLVPTFVPFTPWTTPAGYADLLDEIERLGLVEHVAPVQLAIRLLITAGSPLLEDLDVRRVVTSFDGASLTWPWRHPDPRVDGLQASVMRLAAAGAARPRAQVFHAIAAMARETAGLPPRPMPARVPAAIPVISEPWYCCAEPLETF